MKCDVIIMFNPVIAVALTLYLMLPPQDGQTALLLASMNGHEDVVRLLLQSGAKDVPKNVSVYWYCFNNYYTP